MANYDPELLAKLLALLQGGGGDTTGAEAKILSSVLSGQNKTEAIGAQTAAKIQEMTAKADVQNAARTANVNLNRLQEEASRKARLRVIDDIVRLGGVSGAVGADNPRVVEVAKTLRTHPLLKDAEGPAMAARVETEAAKRAEQAITRIEKGYARQLRDMTPEQRLTMRQDMRDTLAKGRGEKPVIRALIGKHVDAGRAATAADRLAKGVAGVNRASILQEVPTEYANLAADAAKAKDPTLVKHYLTKGRTAGKVGKATKTGIYGAGGALLLGYLASKMFGKKEEAQGGMNPELQMMMMQQMQGGGASQGVNTSRTLSDMSRMVGLIKMLQSMQAQEPAVPTASAII